jgi:hypothetical protein
MLLSSDSALVLDGDKIVEEILATYSLSGPLDTMTFSSNNTNSTVHLNLTNIKAHFSYPGSSMKDVVDYDVKTKSYCACGQFVGLLGGSSLKTEERCQYAPDYQCIFGETGLGSNVDGVNCFTSGASICYGTCFKELARYPMYILENPVYQGMSFYYGNQHFFVPAESFVEVNATFNISLAQLSSSFLPDSLHVVCETQDACWIIPEEYLNKPNECNPGRMNPYIGYCSKDLYQVKLKDCKKGRFDYRAIEWLHLSTCPGKQLISPINIKERVPQVSLACRAPLNNTYCAVTANNTELLLRLDDAALLQKEGEEVKSPAWITSSKASYWLSNGNLYNVAYSPVNAFTLTVDVNDFIATIRSKNLTGVIPTRRCKVTVGTCNATACTLLQDRCQSDYCLLELYGNGTNPNEQMLISFMNGSSSVPKRAGMNTGGIICGGEKSNLMYSEAIEIDEDRDVPDSVSHTNLAEDLATDGASLKGIGGLWTRFKNWVSEQKSAFIASVLGVIGCVVFFSLLMAYYRKRNSSLKFPKAV